MYIIEWDAKFSPRVNLGSYGNEAMNLNSPEPDLLLKTAGVPTSISGSERSSRSRIGSTADIRNENGEIDYKKLYEQQLAENEKLKDKLRKSDEELRETKQTLERINVVTSKNSLSELEKRERRAMERKLSEMEEELKQLQKLKAENERLKADNRSLTRVISKLTNSTKK
ncbi:hypothetical protein NQ318_004791 [Aromia moschata]|uniref:cGMP-dependent protein kinase interacting domain-containing protein n=1 Tax=Aromia moschata TaxID=1265417 RepID=A0AAV8XQR4_9CUCU|nr:hypothetical protein NQ318_004791 [Aromia moschata]